tara:strand:+ start:354 stop:554 length:201 start_codon:yes stop_codon:yes gene_type:complete
MILESMGVDENKVLWFKARSGNTEAFGYCDNDGVDTLEQMAGKAAIMARRNLEKMLMLQRSRKEVE